MGKIQETRQLYKDVIEEIAQNEESWKKFLDSSAWNFKYDFDDQILIYAQRPDAKACASIEEWNKKLRRWVNRGTKPIYVFDKSPNSDYPFRLVFDLSDTHNYNNTEYKLWTIKKEYEDEIIESLEASFGDIEAKESLSQAITLISYNMVTDNVEDYVKEAINYKASSKLQNMKDDEIKQLFIITAWASVSYMIMTRCGINAREHIENQEFSCINYFNNQELLTILGTCVSDIAENGLREIAKTVSSLQKNEKLRNRTIEKIDKEIYANDNKNIKGGNENVRENQLHETGRLLYAKSNDGERENTNRQVRTDEIQLSKKLQETRIDNIGNEQGTEQTPNRNSRTSEPRSKTNSRADGKERWNERENERKRSNEMGRSYEQLQDDSRGDSSKRDNLSIDDETPIQEFDNLHKPIPSYNEQMQILKVEANAPTFSFTQKDDNANEEQKYEYHLGDVVYLGVDKYEILGITNNIVTLYDPEFPLLNKQLDFDEFEKRVKDNYANEHLKVTNKKADNSLNENIIEDINVHSEKNIIGNVLEKNSNNFEKIADDKRKLELPKKEKHKKKIQDFILHPEIPIENRTNYRILDENLGVGTPKEKFVKNIEAIKILKKCEQENRYANKEEQEILAQYVGWGGLQQAFDKNDTSWSSEYKELKKLLNDDEYTKARESTLTAFYTPPIVINAIYETLQKMGLKEANILEPSCGIGNFFGMLPEELKKCKMYGVELDEISGKIAQQLYQNSTIAVSGYENADLPDSFFDIVVGNVPFGDFKVEDKKYDKYKFQIHDYFFAKSLDKVRPRWSNSIYYFEGNNGQAKFSF